MNTDSLAMKARLAGRCTAVLTAATLVLLSTSCSTAVKRRTNAATVPDLAIRRKVAGLGAADVRRMLFSGSSFGCDEDDPITVTDPRLVARILTALGHAWARMTPSLNGTDDLVIEMAPRNGRPRDSIYLSFNAKARSDRFGPEFEQALRDLAKAVATRDAARVATVAGAVRAIQVVGGAIVRVRDRTHLPSVLSALQRLTPSAYAYTASKTVPLGVTLVEQGNHRTQLNLVVAPYAGHGPPPLPEPLWSLYKRSMAPPKGG